MMPYHWLVCCSGATTSPPGMYKILMCIAISAFSFLKYGETICLSIHQTLVLVLEYLIACGNLGKLKQSSAPGKRFTSFSWRMDIGIGIAKKKWISLNSHTVGFSQCFTLPSQSSQGFFPSFHCTAQQRVEHEIHHHYQIINQFLKAHQNVSQWLENCAILCKRKDVKVTEESQPNGPRSRYEPYWTYQVQDGWLDHVELRNPMRGGAHSPPLQGCTRERLQSHGQRQLTDSMPRVRLWHVAFKNKFDFHGKKKKKVYTCTADGCCSHKWLETEALR